MSDRYPRTEYQRRLEFERANRAIARREQDAAHGVRSEADLRDQVNQLAQQPGVLSSGLPTVTAHMSAPDRANVQAKLNAYTGMSPTQARDPRMILAATASRTGRALPAPAGSPQDAPAAALPAAALPGLPAPRLLSPDEMQLRKETAYRDGLKRAPEPISVPGGDPAARAWNAARGTGRPQTAEGTALDAAIAKANAAALPLPPPAVTPSSAANAATIAQAKTGNTVQTPYGPVSSRPMNWMDALNDAHGPDWQKKLVALHPEIGVAGSPENKAFVDAMRTPGGMRGDPFAMAKQQYMEREDKRIGDAEAATALPASLPPSPTGPWVPPKSFANAAPGSLEPVDTSTPAYQLAHQAPASKGAPPEGNRYLPVNGWTGANPRPFNPLAPATPATAPYDATAGTPTAPAAAPPTSASTGTTPPLSMANPVAPWHPDADSQAFAQNPAEDEFKKRMREAQQVSYAA